MKFVHSGVHSEFPASRTATSGILIDNPNPGPNDCGARCYRVSIDGRIDVAIVLPEVPDYSPVKVEIIAATPFRETLSVADGDSFRLDIR